MRMVLEHPCRGFVRFGANDGKGAHLVADVGNAARADPLGLAKRSAHRGERSLVLLNPRLPGGHALFLLRLSLSLGQGVPRGHLRAGFAADEDGKIAIAHRISPLVALIAVRISSCGPAVPQIPPPPFARREGNPPFPAPGGFRLSRYRTPGISSPRGSPPPSI